MSDLPFDNQNKRNPSLWPVATVILGVVFGPALIVWALSLLHF